jgi:hypothetical protein
MFTAGGRNHPSILKKFLIELKAKPKNSFNPERVLIFIFPSPCMSPQNKNKIILDILYYICYTVL